MPRWNWGKDKNEPEKPKDNISTPPTNSGANSRVPAPDTSAAADAGSGPGRLKEGAWAVAGGTILTMSGGFEPDGRFNPNRSNNWTCIWGEPAGHANFVKLIQFLSTTPQRRTGPLRTFAPAPPPGIVTRAFKLKIKWTGSHPTENQAIVRAALLFTRDDGLTLHSRYWFEMPRQAFLLNALAGTGYLRLFADPFDPIAVANIRHYAMPENLPLQLDMPSLHELAQLLMTMRKV